MRDIATGASGEPRWPGIEGARRAAIYHALWSGNAQEIRNLDGQVVLVVRPVHD